MKPGNLFIKVLNPAATKDEDSIHFNAHRIFGVRFFFVRTNLRRKKKGKQTWKKDSLPLNVLPMATPTR